MSLILSRWEPVSRWSARRWRASELPFRASASGSRPWDGRIAAGGTRSFVAATERLNRGGQEWKGNPSISSVISEVGYNASCRTLEILFKSGAIYLYYFVPEEVHRGLMNAASHGTYFNQEIKANL